MGKWIGIEALECRCLLAFVIDGRAAPDPLDEAILFRLPLAADTSVHYYFDRDSTSGIRAWNGTTQTYNGHTGSDYSGGPRGKPVYAAADGILTARVDQYGDFEGPGNGNYIKLNHGNDRNGQPIVTFYLHLNLGTPINLPLGTFIAAGTQIGGVGTSGNSTGFHLHLHTTYAGTAFDPYAAAGETTWWVNQGSGAPVTTTPAAKFQNGNWVEVFALSGSTLTVRAPNPTSSSIGTQANGAVGQILDGPALSYTAGDYNNQVYTRYKVRFGNGMEGWVAHNWLKAATPAEIDVQHNGTAIVDGQNTSIGFGAVERRQPGPTKEFKVTNTGIGPLTLGAVTVPNGFTLVEGLVSTLAAGQSDTFTIRLDTVNQGLRAGFVNIVNNDADENPFNFPISGSVTADVTPPVADIIDVTPDPRSSPLASVSIVFNEPVFGLDWEDFILTRNGGAIALSSAQTISTSDNLTFTLSNLTPLTQASGTYTLTLTGGVVDDSNNQLQAPASDTFKIQTALFRGDATGVVADSYLLRRSSNGANVEIFENIPAGPTPSYVLPFAALTALSFETGGGGDALTIDYVNGDPVPPGAGALSYSATGGKALTLAGAGVFKLHQNTALASLEVVAGARLDVSDKEVIVTDATAGAWNGSAYTGITGLVASGRNGGSWNGVGIVTSMTAAASPGALMTLGVAPLDAGVKVAYARAGDTNLDGRIDADDYFNLDAGYASQGSGYARGDFDYNGRIDGEDYFLIDSNFSAAPPAQPAPSAGAELPGVMSWPAPSREWSFDQLLEPQQRF